MDGSKYTFNSKIRLLGYYNYPNQVMKPETEYVEEAKELVRLLTSSINSLLSNPETDGRDRGQVRVPPCPDVLLPILI